ncbi:hypothetical protein IMCC20628_01963 [Hoeflea sp. IMCC20628]|uniref:hypothetical protein n=1 Tax=Hoeflea sp. IMCC20628 TaxID=1620421 RepID=UPI00063AD1E6|nr:hypothetical protein [Hoeflea sp. IMCC20628]AKI00669.1 hypothetical protein IMCC20628_01963 [Hoeflea sp. IMCC20628]
MQPKKHALTQLGENRSPNRVYARRDTNCPVIVHVRKRNAEERIAVPSWMVNICEDGCLITSDYLPYKVEDVYIIIPGFGSKVHGLVKNQGKFTLNIKFSTLLPADIVDKVARIKTIAKT